MGARRKQAPPTYSEAALAKLAASGLDAEQAQRLGIEELDAAGANKLQLKVALPGLLLRYYDPTTDEPTDFWRFRYLSRAAGFAEQTTAKALRYVQPPRSAPRAYFPRGVDWPDLFEDVDWPLILTEGELKAAAACEAGLPTIGLGGVFSWRALEQGIDWLPDLNLPVWARRNVYVVFDSDARTNPQVLAALEQLTTELERRGAIAHGVILPDLEEGGKTGLDDFLVARGSDALRAELKEAAPVGLATALWKLNGRYTFVRHPPMVVDRSGRKLTPSDFMNAVEAPTTAYRTSRTATGDIKREHVPAAPHWIKWPLRHEVMTLTYAPGREAEFLDQRGERVLNTWEGWGCQPDPTGDPQPFLDLVDHLFTGAPPEAKLWFLRWCAYPLQYPGTKLSTAAVVYGTRHGTGKSLIGVTLGRIYGSNYSEIDHRDLDNGFNEWAVGKQFILGDDVAGQDKRQDADLLKKLITQQLMRINQKHLPTYTLPDCLNYYFTSNHPDAFYLEDHDRRYFIHEVQVGPLPEVFYVDYGLWLDTGGAAAVFNYLLHLDLGDFNPYGAAFMTVDKQRMMTTGQSDLATWVRQLRDSPEDVLRVGQTVLAHDLFTTQELLALYSSDGDTRVTANGLGRELQRAGFRQVADGRPLRVNGSPQARYYAIRNADLWLTAPPAKVLKHLQQGHGKNPR